MFSGWKYYYKKLPEVSGDFSYYKIEFPFSVAVTDPVTKLLFALKDGDKGSSELRKIVGIKHRDTFRKNYLHPALEANYIEYTIPDDISSRNQKYHLTEKGKKHLNN